MKYKDFNEFKEAYKKRAMSPEFRKAGLETMEKIHNEILDKPIVEWLDIAADISPDRNGESEWRHALEAIVRDIRPKSQEHHRQKRAHGTRYFRASDDRPVERRRATPDRLSPRNGARNHEPKSRERTLSERRSRFNYRFHEKH
jgi:hypothetical protein